MGAIVGLYKVFAGIAGVSSAGAAALTAATIIANVVTVAAISFGLNRLLAKKPSNPGLDASSLNNTITVKSATAPRQLIYGRVRTGGVMVYAEVSGTGNEFLNLVIALAGHEVEEIGDIYFDDAVVPLSSNAATGTFAGYAWVYKHLGTSTQTVDTDLQSAVTSAKWSNDHRLRGIAYIYVKLKYSQNLFPGGIPNISAVVKGRKVLDTRTNTTAYSTNWALCVRDYLTLSGLGLGADATEIDTTECDAAANVADEDVVLDDLSTEKRYTINGVVDLNETPGTILQKLCSAGAGSVFYVGGKWVIRAGAYQTPTLTFDEDDFRGPLSVQTRLSRREIFNGVKGLYVSEDNQWQPADFPQIVNSTYTTEDGGERIWRDVELPFTTSNATAQRLAKIELERCRQQITVRAPMKLTAMQCQVGDNIQLTNTRMGWSSKVFEVVDFSFVPETQDDAVSLGVDLVLRETASAVWDWSDGEETVVDAAPDTDLFDPLTVETAAGLTLSTENFIQTDGTVAVRLKAVWTAPTSQYILSGGYVHIEYKKSADSDWLIWTTTLRGNVSQDYITDVQSGTAYDVRVRFENVNSVLGDYDTETNYTVLADATAPSAPTGLTATAGAGFVSLDWDDSTAADLGEYAVYRHTSNTFAGATKIAEVLASRFVDANSISPGTTYYYWVTAIDRSDNESSESSSANAAPTAPINNSAPRTPSAPTYSSEGTYQSGDGNTFSYIVIDTPALPTGAIALDVLYRVSGSSSWIIADQLTSDTTARIDDLTPGVTYEFAVRGVSSGGALSAVSTTLSRAAPNSTSAPSAPTGLAATGTLESITLDWDDNTEDDLAYYEVWRHTSNSSGSATRIANTLSSRFVDTLPSGTTTYYYWIKAVDRSGNASSFSSVASAAANSQSGGVTFTLSLSNSTGNPLYNPSGAGTYAAGSVVNIVAVDPAGSDPFINWTGGWPDVDFVENVNAANTNVVMNSDVTLIANY
jgi:fibronectin type 3 domain-containing protein